jgi:two-component system, chemotaxis family, CheB/CheR fusion protein
VNPNLAIDNLAELIRTTIDGVGQQELEVRDRDGRWYSLRVRPYKGVDNRLDGAVITAIDIDVRRRYQQHIERSRDYFRKVVESVSQPLLVLNEDLRVQTANDDFCKLFQRSRQQLEGRPIVEIDDQPWKLPALREAIKAAAAGGEPGPLPIDYDLEGLGRRRVAITVRGFELDDLTRWLLLAIEITDADEAS